MRPRAGKGVNEAKLVLSMTLNKLMLSMKFNKVVHEATYWEGVSYSLGPGGGATLL